MQEQFDEGYQFSREELMSKVIVPKDVETELRGIVEERLDQCAFYHRTFSRIKSPESLEHKYQFKRYDENNKIQDLIGIRVDLYFEDDLALCQDILEKSFEFIEWASTESDEGEFKATKINGIFRLPRYVKERISAETWGLGIDDTFEVQLKTMFFEGWHEIEHDFRYKNEKIWEDRLSYSRYFNSILATLELCDKSMITLFDDLGHDLYKEGHWQEMIQVHFRLKMGDSMLYPEVVERFKESYRQETNNLAKQIYKCPRKRLIDALMKRNYRIPVNVNTIVAMLNEFQLHDETLTKIFKEKDVYNDGRSDSQRGANKNYELTPLLSHRAFSSKVEINTETVGLDEAFKKAVEFSYNWLKSKFGGCMPDIPKEVSTYYGIRYGFRIGILYDGNKHKFLCQSSHIDFVVNGRMWVTNINIDVIDDKLMLSVANSYAEPDKGHHTDAAKYFSYPRFYREICDNIGAYDVVKLDSKRRIIGDEKSMDALIKLILDKNRIFPIVFVVSEEDRDGMMDERWLGQFRVSDFTKTVWRYCHVYTGYSKIGEKLFKRLSATRVKLPGVYVFWPGFTAMEGDGINPFYESYDSEDVRTCSFGRHRETRDDVLTYDIVRGGQGFYHKLLTDIRNYNVVTKLDNPINYNAYDTPVVNSNKSEEELSNVLNYYGAFVSELVSDNERLREEIDELKKKLYK
ncbi:MAG: hypothetical protein K5656_00730 [Lachnospiraceae bacterium]|nr:hypothetical protein [Lachnospiraceae bacterium]